MPLERRLPTRFSALTAFVLILAGTTTPMADPNREPAPAGLTVATLEHAGLTRSYLLDLAPARPGTGKRPLVLVLHGGRGTAARIAASLGFGEVAHREGFAVAYPQAIEGNWNDGRGVQRYTAQREQIDDVGFLRRLGRVLVREHDLDPDRVFVTGPSNGGMMSLRLALEAPAEFSAVAAVIANLPEKVAERHSGDAAPQPAVPLLLLVGQDDPLMPFAGGEITFAGRPGFGSVLSSEETARFFAARYGCDPSPATTLLPNRALLDGTRVELRTFTGTASSCEIRFYVIDGGGHTWAGTRQRLPPALVGRTSQDVEATELIWEFFAAQSRRES